MNIEPNQIPRKSHLKLKEVSDITGVKPYVLRFWETEFEEISPITASNGQKIYEYDDIETILKIKRLLFDEKLAIKEAQHRLRHQELSPMDLPGPPEVELNSAIQARGNETLAAEEEPSDESSYRIKEQIGNAAKVLDDLISHIENLKQRKGWQQSSMTH